MKGNLSYIINDFFQTYDEQFSIDIFSEYLRENGYRLPRDVIENVLETSDIVFHVEDDIYTTRGAVFKNAIFSFMPSREEIEKGMFVMGARGIPYVNPLYTSDSIRIYSKGKKVKSKGTEFSMNFLLDAYALYGEGYNVLNIINDRKNDKYSGMPDPYNMPSKVKQTSYPFNKIEGGDDIEYGDRVICKVKNWADNEIEVWVQKGDRESLVVSRSVIEREQWYCDFEKQMLYEIDRVGPTDSILTQLTIVVVNGDKKLNRTENCGAISEFLAHTKKIEFKPYGVENRIWKTGEDIPFSGNWNGNDGIAQLYSCLSEMIDQNFFEILMYNDIYEKYNHKETAACKLIWEEIIPKVLRFHNTHKEQLIKEVFLNIEKRRDILEESYNPFENYTCGEIRRRAIMLFSRVSSLVSDIVFTADNLDGYPSEELILLCQLFTHLIRLLFEVEDVATMSEKESNSMLEGMSDTFDDVETTLRGILLRSSKNSFRLISENYDEEN